VTSTEPSATCPLHAVATIEIAAIAAQYAHRTRRTADNQLHLRAGNPAQQRDEQGGAGADQVVIDDPSHAPVFFLDGEDHRRKRTPSPFLHPKAIATRHRAVMENTTDASPS